VLICPSSPRFHELKPFKDALAQKPPNWDLAQRIIGRQYIYLGWALRDEKDWERLLSVPNPVPGADLKVGDESLYWLQEGVEMHFVSDSSNPAEAAEQQNLIPVMCDNPAANNHIPLGVNVLYLDGHVEYVKMGARFPALPSVAKYFADHIPKK